MKHALTGPWVFESAAYWVRDVGTCWEERRLATIRYARTTPTHDTRAGNPGPGFPRSAPPPLRIRPTTLLFEDLECAHSLWRRAGHIYPISAYEDARTRARAHADDAAYVFYTPIRVPAKRKR